MSHYQHEQTKDKLAKEIENTKDYRRRLLELNDLYFKLMVDNHRYRAALEGRSCSKQTSSIDQTMWRRLIQLVHTDKHNNNEASNIATKWLLEQR